jgi:hypothetical protein
MTVGKIRRIKAREVGFGLGFIGTVHGILLPLCHFGRRVLPPSTSATLDASVPVQDEASGFAAPPFDRRHLYRWNDDSHYNEQEIYQPHSARSRFKWFSDGGNEKIASIERSFLYGDCP